MHSFREIKKTEDGWNTLYIPELDETYHSIHGARQESEHIFISEALEHSTVESPTIFEVGFGTGLNAILTYIYAQKNQKKITFYSIEKYPLTKEEYENLGYNRLLSKDEFEAFIKLHSCPWETLVEVSEYFSIYKFKADLLTVEFPFTNIDVVYFDAFSPNNQADLWTTEVFTKIAKQMTAHAVLTTYCAKGQVRRNMIEAGFKVERRPGPPGKREMLRAGF